MMKLLALALAIYFVVSLAAYVSKKSLPQSKRKCAAADIIDAAYEPDGSIVDAQFSHMPESPEAAPMLAMIDGQLYRCTGQDSDIDGRCGMMDGRIDSSVEQGEVPVLDGQSNFGAPYGYQYGSEGCIELNIDRRWLVFEPVQSPSVARPEKNTENS